MPLRIAISKGNRASSCVSSGTVMYRNVRIGVEVVVQMTHEMR